MQVLVYDKDKEHGASGQDRAEHRQSFWFKLG